MAFERIELTLNDRSPILQRYRTCTDAASVLAMQEVMILEMEKEQDERRAFSPSSAAMPADGPFGTGEAKAKDEEDGELLLENPNHAGGAWRPYHEDEESERGSEEERGESVEELTQILKAL